MSAMRQATLALLVLGAVALAPRATRADDAAAPAEALFEHARHLMAEHRYAEACRELTASQELDPALGTLLNLADCEEKLGRTASAWASFHEAAGLASAAQQHDREIVARARAAALEPRLAKLTVIVASSEPGLVVLRDGLPVAHALFGLAFPVDPGPHVIEARAPGKVPHRSIIDVPAGKPARVSITIPALADAPEAQRTREADDARATRRTIGFVALGLGGGSILAGSLLAVRAVAQNAASAGHCRSMKLCDAEGVALRDDAFAAAGWSTAAFVAGSLLLGGGATLVLTAPRDDAAPHATVALHVAGTSMALEGAW